MEECLPQEIEVRYIVPALRGQLAKALLAQGMNQKEVASILKLTEGAISQYVHGKRGNEVEFSKEVLEQVKVSASKIAKDKETLLPELYRLTQLTTVKKIMCDMHRKQSKELDDCTMCFSKEELLEIKL